RSRSARWPAASGWRSTTGCCASRRNWARQRGSPAGGRCRGEQDRTSDRPVFDGKPRDLTEVTEGAGESGRPVDECDAGNAQVHRAYPEPLPAQVVKLVLRRLIERKHLEGTKLGENPKQLLVAAHDPGGHTTLG